SQLLVSGGDGGTFGGNNLFLWRVADGSLVRAWSPWPVPSDHVLLVSFSPDGQTIAAAATNHSIVDNYIDFWRVSDGGLVRIPFGTLGTAQGDLEAAAFSPDWTTLARYHGSQFGSLTLTRL